MTKSIVTYQSPSGYKLDICPACAERRRAAGDWPRDHTGQEYCTVSHGAHRGLCQVCDEAQAKLGGVQ